MQAALQRAKRGVCKQRGNVNSRTVTVTRASQTSQYPFSQIEQKWQAQWEAHEAYRTPPINELDTNKPKFYALDMFPYPSGDGLHVGHPEGYTATDIISRYKRMNGYNVLHPMGFDAFGLPAEQHAKETGTHPRNTTERNISRFREQLKSLGFSYDWSREISTSDVSYYRWTQWIFTRLLEHGLAYRADVPVNWCEALGTVLANEEVIGGVSERGGYPVERKPMRQWMLNITAYADRLLDGLDKLDWPESIKEMQRNWIGRSYGAEIRFECPSNHNTIEVFTTRPDTIAGVTFLAIAPEHPDALVLAEAGGTLEAVQEFQKFAQRRSDIDRTAASNKRGQATGSFARNPLTGEDVPVYVADYVLGHHGTGAVMGVPAHDERDLAFAHEHSLGAPEAVRPMGEESEAYDAFQRGALENDGVAAPNVPLENLAGQKSAEVRQEITAELERLGAGKGTVSYKLRDWLFARQRYWGEPFPVIIKHDGSVAPVPDSHLPLQLPHLEGDMLKPPGTGEGPLANASEWVNEPEDGKRETSTMPQWAGSCWYFLRFIDPGNPHKLVDPQEEQYWMPVDLYIGGAEHAVLHLLYARFWHKFLHDIGVVSTDEPFQRLVTQGMILGEPEYLAPWDFEAQQWATNESDNTEEVKVSADQVEEVGDKNGSLALAGSNGSVPVFSRSRKMSKSKGNVVNPDDIIAGYGADSMRLYEMFMGPLTETKPWSTRGVEGVHRFLGRVWRLVNDGGNKNASPTEEQLRDIHGAIKRVTEYTNSLRFNTAISSMMELVNAMYKWDNRPKWCLEQLALLLAPYAPHIAEEAWERLGNEGFIVHAAWPAYDPAMLETLTVSMPVQVNGKVRAQLELPKDASEEDALELAKQDHRVQKWLQSGELKKQVYVPGKIINFAVAQQ